MMCGLPGALQVSADSIVPEWCVPASGLMMTVIPGADARLPASSIAVHSEHVAAAGRQAGGVPAIHVDIAVRHHVLANVHRVHVELDARDCRHCRSRARGWPRCRDDDRAGRRTQKRNLRRGRVLAVAAGAMKPAARQRAQTRASRPTIPCRRRGTATAVLQFEVDLHPARPARPAFAAAPPVRHVERPRARCRRSGGPGEAEVEPGAACSRRAGPTASGVDPLHGAAVERNSPSPGRPWRSITTVSGRVNPARNRARPGFEST